MKNLELWKCCCVSNLIQESLRQGRHKILLDEIVRNDHNQGDESDFANMHMKVDLTGLTDNQGQGTLFKKDLAVSGRFRIYV